jgi:hypothetical protein
MEIYIVLGYRGKNKDCNKSVVYAGPSKDKAFNQEANEVHYSYSVELWSDEIPMKSWYGSKEEWKPDAYSVALERQKQ